MHALLHTKEDPTQIPRTSTTATSTTRKLNNYFFSNFHRAMIGLQFEQKCEKLGRAVSVQLRSINRELELVQEMCQMNRKNTRNSTAVDFLFLLFSYTWLAR